MTELEFETLVKPYRKQLDSYSMLLCKNRRDDALDLQQETLAKVWHYRNKYRREKPIGGWLRTIMSSVFHDIHIKKKNFQRNKAKVHSFSEFQFNNEEKEQDWYLEDHSQDLMANLAYKDLVRQVNKLPKEYRDAVVLYAKGYTYLEITAMFNIPMGTVRSRIFRGRELLYKQLQELAQAEAAENLVSPATLPQRKRSYSKKASFAETAGVL